MLGTFIICSLEYVQIGTNQTCNVSYYTETNIPTNLAINGESINMTLINMLNSISYFSVVYNTTGKKSLVVRNVTQQQVKRTSDIIYSLSLNGF